MSLGKLQKIGQKKRENDKGNELRRRKTDRLIGHAWPYGKYKGHGKSFGGFYKRTQAQSAAASKPGRGGNFRERIYTVVYPGLLVLRSTQAG